MTQNEFQGRHEVLAIMLGFLLEEIARIVATKPFDFPQVCNTRLEIEKFLEEKYGHSLSFNIYH
jgi:hypothetical protein